MATDGILSITHLFNNRSVWLMNSMLHSASWLIATFAWTMQHKRGNLVIKSPTSHLKHGKGPITWPLWITIPRLAFSLSIKGWVNIGCGAENWQGKSWISFTSDSLNWCFCADWYCSYSNDRQRGCRLTGSHLWVNSSTCQDYILDCSKGLSITGNYSISN